MTTIKVHYIRPGKGETIYFEEFVSEDETRLKTFVNLPADTILSLNAALQKDGVTTAEQEITGIRKTYFFNQYFNVLEFLDNKNQLVGYYSDIGSRLVKIQDGYKMDDWYLDIWLTPQGKIIELDWDEFEEACSKNILNSTEQEQAKATMRQLVGEAKNNIYPHLYIKD